MILNLNDNRTADLDYPNHHVRSQHYGSGRNTFGVRPSGGSGGPESPTRRRALESFHKEITKIHYFSIFFERFLDRIESHFDSVICRARGKTA